MIHKGSTKLAHESPVLCFHRLGGIVDLASCHLALDLHTYIYIEPLSVGVGRQPCGRALSVRPVLLISF